MMQRDDAGYHRNRAENEINLALAAADLNVARAHFGLARLHAERLRDLGGPETLRRPLIRM